MNTHLRGLISLLAVAGVAACSNDVTGPATHPVSARPSFSGGVNSGGANSGGTSTGGGGTSTNVDPTAVVAGPPTLTALVDSVGNTVVFSYYGVNPKDWYVGGHRFKTTATTRITAKAGPLVVGACATVTYTTGVDADYASEIKSLDASKCP